MFSQADPKQRTLVIGLIILGILFTVFFGMRVAHAYKKFNGHRPPPHGKVETEVELIRSWMTIPFISELYHVPEKIIFDALKIPSQENREKSLRDLNHEYYPDANEFVLDTVRKTILAHQPPSPPDASPAPAVP
jgi:hypothetical protein